MEYEDNDVLQRAGDFSKSKKKEKKRGEAQKACGHRSAFARRLKDQGKREEKRRERREEGGNDFAFAGRRAEKVMRSSHGYRVDEERNGRHEGEDGGRRRPQRGFSHQNRRQAEDRAFRADRRDDDSDWKSRIYGRKKGEDDVARHEGAPSPRGNRHEDRWRQSYGWEGKKEHFHSAKEDRHFDQERGEKQERRDRKSFGHRQERGFHAGKGAEPGKEGRSWPGEKDRSRNGGKSGRFAKRSPRKGFARDAQENARTGGMPEEFFRIETVGEEKPAFRFGKRRK